MLLTVGQWNVNGTSSKMLSEILVNYGFLMVEAMSGCGDWHFRSDRNRIYFWTICWCADRCLSVAGRCTVDGTLTEISSETLAFVIYLAFNLFVWIGDFTFYGTTNVGNVLTSVDVMTIKWSMIGQCNVDKVSWEICQSQLRHLPFPSTLPRQNHLRNPLQKYCMK